MFSRLVICCLICACLLSPQTVRGEGTLPWPQAENVVRRYFAEAWNDRDVNLMCRGHASFVFQQLNQLGWKVADEKGILKDTPEDHEYLIQVLASSHGQRLLKHLPDEKLLYDRLDRIIKQPGGRRLVRDLLRLPDGYRYAQAKRPSGSAGDALVFAQNVAGQGPDNPRLR